MELPETAITRYSDIVNSTLSMGYFPIILKNRVIILILKPGKNPTKPINYRPITLLELPGKIIEWIINNRLQKFYEENLYNKNQYGFRAGRGTGLALAKIYEQIALNQKYRDGCNIV